MKSYGYMKATEFTRKQIGVLYHKAKDGEIKIEKWVMSDFYNLSDYYGYDDGGAIEFYEGKILNILDAIFSGDLVEAQKQIDWYTETSYDGYSDPQKAKLNRELVK